MTADRRAPFDEAPLLADAQRKAGFSDFGDSAFREPLRVLLASLAEAPLNAVGQLVLRTSIRRSLVQRLLAQHWETQHPEIAREPIEGPIVVVGQMRSGTTLIQRLLACDPRFYCAYGWEIAEPAPRPGTVWSEIDPRIADAEARAQQMRDFSPDLYAIHPTAALEADEEIVFLADAFLSHVPEASCHVPAYRTWLDRQDFTPAYLYLNRMLRLLQWQKRLRGAACERWLLKTPAHLGYLDTLFAVFPGARVLHMHRSPLETIPSGASLNFTLWKLYADEVDPTEVGRQWLERMGWTTRRALAVRDRLPDASERFVDVWYRDAVADPLGCVERIYAALGFELAPETRRRMERWLASDARAKGPAHQYTAEQFGLTERAIRDAFADYMARFIDLEEA
jgi:Sulfotransferase family